MYKMYVFSSEERNKHFSIGKKKFNTNPKAGIKYLIDHQLLNNSPEAVADFMFSSKDLRKTAIGEYIGEKDDFHLAVMNSFIGRQNFRGQPLVPCLRIFLNSFRLPGEAQKIDRLMECFAKKYCEQNPHVFQNSGSCKTTLYLLSNFFRYLFRTLLLNNYVEHIPPQRQCEREDNVGQISADA